MMKIPPSSFSFLNLLHLGRHKGKIITGSLFFRVISYPILMLASEPSSACSLLCRGATHTRAFGDLAYHGDNLLRSSSLGFLPLPADAHSLACRKKDVSPTYFHSSSRPKHSSSPVDCSDEYISIISGNLGEKDFKLNFFKSDGRQKISPWHHIPLQTEGNLFNFVVEITKETAAKMEIATKEPFNPIVQDVKNGALRYYSHAIHWNYGAFPRTWEDPMLKGGAEVNGAFGDNDPLDVVEIGQSELPMGCVCKVKVLGAFSLIDEGELDWKIISLKKDDPYFDLINDVGDIEKFYPKTVENLLEWFRSYKVPAGSPPNKIGHGGRPINRDQAIQVIKETHHSYNHMIKQAAHDKLWIPKV